MEGLVLALLLVIGAAGVGAGVGFAASRGRLLLGASDRAREAAAEAERVVGEAEAKRKELLLEAKEEAIRLKLAVEADARAQQQEIKAEQQRLRNREEALDRKVENVQARERLSGTKEQEIEARRREVEELRSGQRREVERIARLSVEEARELLLSRVEGEMREEAGRRERIILAQAKLSADEEARRLITLAVQRLPGEHNGEMTVMSVPIPKEMKGRIIGRDGQNIQTLEAATGVDLVIDETTDAVMISGFDPVRREIARVALTKLVTDGRIHPARIEEVVAKATAEVEARILKAGKEGALEAGVRGVHPEVLKVLGRMKYRTSYGQNQLAHSVEAAQIARILAAELGADAEVAARATLLHDIGKVLGHDVEGPHHVIGADLVRRFGESQRVHDAIVEHHDSDPEVVSIEAVIVQAADAISGARPGARHESVENYIKRLEALEQVANSFPGVEKSFAIQAGREVRIIVKPEEVDDLGSIRLARDIAKKIEDSLQYPGQVRVTVVRETRAFEIAR